MELASRIRVRLALTSHAASPGAALQATERRARACAMDTLKRRGGLVSKTTPSEQATGDGVRAPL